MSHFAKVEDGIVTNILVIEQDILDSDDWGDSNDWVQTSYNTRGGVHHAPNSSNPDDGTPLRKNYAGIGYTYDSDKDAFIPLKPFPSWNLDDDTCQWNAPTSYPDDGKDYLWDEDTTSWIEQ
jgi:hypothetical protein